MPPVSRGGLTHRPNSSSRAEPSMIIPLPKLSCACATVPFSPGTTRCFSNPKALHSHSIAAFASRYRIAGMTVDTVFLGLLGILSSSRENDRKLGPYPHPPSRPRWSPLSRGAGEEPSAGYAVAPLPHRGRGCRAQRGG